MYYKYKCLGCGKIFRGKKIPAICPDCQKKVLGKEAWGKIIAKCERFIERIKGT